MVCLRCPYCGIKLMKVGNTYFCSNCGKIDFDSEEINGKERGYIN